MLPEKLPLSMVKTSTCLIFLVISAHRVAVAQSPTKLTDMVCPQEFYADGNRCVPIRDKTRPALRMAGRCPAGYHSKGKHCVKDTSSPVTPSGDPRCPHEAKGDMTGCVGPRK